MNSNIENAILIIDIVVHSGYVICGISIFLYLIVFITRNFINEMKFNDIINAKETVFYYILILVYLLMLIIGLIVCCYIIIHNDLIAIGMLS